MAVKSVKATINGQEYTLTLNSGTGKYEATITAPATSSFNNNDDHYYPVEVKVTDMADNVTTKNDTDEEGPFILGEILTKTIDDDTKSTLVAYSNALFATNYTIQLSNSIGTPITIRQNKDIVLNTIAYLSDREDAIRIRKDVGGVSFQAATESQNRVVLGIIFGVPILIIIAGIVIAIIRKVRK